MLRQKNSIAILLMKIFQFLFLVKRHNVIKLIASLQLTTFFCALMKSKHSIMTALLFLIMANGWRELAYTMIALTIACTVSVDLLFERLRGMLFLFMKMRRPLQG